MDAVGADPIQDGFNRSFTMKIGQWIGITNMDMVGCTQIPGRIEVQQTRQDIQRFVHQLRYLEFLTPKPEDLAL